MLKKALAVGLLSVGVFSAGLSVVSAEEDKNCGDFSNHDEVMEFWHSNGYSATNDPHGLDRDNDGLACEVDADEYEAFVANKEQVKSEQTKQGDDDQSKEESSQATVSSDSNDSNGSDSAPVTENAEGGELPDTATNNPLMMMSGAIIAAIGGLFFIRKRQTN